VDPHQVLDPSELTPEAIDLLRRLRNGELVPAPQRDPARPAPPGQAAPPGQPAPPGAPPDPPAGNWAEDEPPLDPAPGRWRSALADRLPASLRGAAVDPALRGALSLGLVALLAALVAVVLAWRSAPTPVPVPVAAPAVVANSAPAAISPAPPAAPGPTSAGPAATGAAGLVVDVAGKVRRPGVVTVPSGARVADALQQAGGALPGTDTSALSLARKLVDGEQILVTGKPGTAPAPAGGAPAGASPSQGTSSAATAAEGASPATGPIDLNTATVDQLDGLPGVGPVLAGRILAWRTEHNGFTSVDQLREVKGLGGKTGQQLMALVRVG
jgi:competence protein ComEA